MSLDSPVLTAVPASGLKIAVIATQFNAALVESLLARVLGRLQALGVKDRNLTLARVPGSNELPIAAALLINRKRPDAVVALGVIIRGDTIHYELIATAATNGLMDVALGSGVPVINGVIVAETLAQARARCQGKIDRGAEFADAAVAMAGLRRNLSK